MTLMYLIKKQNNFVSKIKKKILDLKTKMKTKQFNLLTILRQTSIFMIAEDRLDLCDVF